MMNMNIKGLHMELTDAIKTRVDGKITALEHFVPGDAYVSVRVGKTSNHHKGSAEEFLAEVTLDTYGHMYFIENRNQDLYAAIDSAFDEITNQIKQGRGKRQTIARKGRMMLKRLTRKGFYGWNK